MLVLLGIAVVVFGLVARANPLLVVMAAAITTGLAAAWTPQADLVIMWQASVDTLARFGKAFNDNRFISLVWMVLIAIGLLERSGLQERARMVIARIPAATWSISRTLLRPCATVQHCWSPHFRTLRPNIWCRRGCRGRT